MSFSDAENLLYLIIYRLTVILYCPLLCRNLPLLLNTIKSSSKCNLGFQYLYPGFFCGDHISVRAFYVFLFLDFTFVLELTIH
jgi:hypothetical protein